MEDSNKNKKRDIILMVVAIAGLYTAFHFLKIGCPIKYFTGISCAGCGMSRAWLSVLKLDFISAFHFHPLYFMVPIGIVVFLFRKRIPNKVYKIIVWVGLMSFLCVYIIRMIDQNDYIVVANIRNGAIIRLINGGY